MAPIGTAPAAPAPALKTAAAPAAAAAPSRVGAAAPVAGQRPAPATQRPMAPATAPAIKQVDKILIFAAAFASLVAVGYNFYVFYFVLKPLVENFQS